MDNNKGRRFWNWTVPKDGTDGAPNKDRVLFLSGAIAEESWFDDEVTPGVFREELMSGDGPVTVWINSPGGDCIAAAQIYNMLIDYPGDVTVKIDGLAASAASVIAMAGTKVLMKSGSAIHETVAALGRAGLLQRASMVADCGLPSERVFRDLREIPENVSYFATILGRSE